MAIKKEKCEKPYSIIPGEYLRNPDLSFKERGMMATLYSLPENWVFTIEGLAAIVNDGISVTRSTFKKLVKKGYIRQHTVRGADGRFVRTDLELFIHANAPNAPPDDFPHVEKPVTVSPQADCPSAGKPQKDKPYAEKQRESNINESIMKESNIKKSITKGYKIGSGNACSGRRRNSFNNFPQRDYNFEELEKQLLQAQYQVTSQASKEGIETDKAADFREAEGSDDG